MKRGLAALAIALTAVALAHAQDGAPPSFTQAQAQQGGEVYTDHCASCHGANLNDGQFGPALKGARFKSQWGGKSVGALFTYLSANMPPGQAGVLAADDYANLIAFLLQSNGEAAGDKPLASDPGALSGEILPP
jgi:mono/diheme cytochrome c family protein